MHSLDHVELLSIGLNCSLGAKEIRPYLEEMARNHPTSFLFTPMQACPTSLENMMKPRNRWLFISRISSIRVL